MSTCLSPSAVPNGLAPAAERRNYSGRKTIRQSCAPQTAASLLADLDAEAPTGDRYQTRPAPSTMGTGTKHEVAVDEM